MSQDDLGGPITGDGPHTSDEYRRQVEIRRLESSNAMWGWIAGAVVLALVLMFVFTRSHVGS